MAHGDPEAQATFDRHLPYWRAHGFPLFVACPTDSVVNTGIPMFTIGRRSHHDAMANYRFRKTLEFLATVPSDWFVIHEYDSLCLEPVIPIILFEHGRIMGNVFQNNDPNFEGSQFIHPPLLMDRETLLKIVSVGQDVPDEAEHGFWDRWLGLVCDRGGIEVCGYGNLGFSRNTIEAVDYSIARARVRDGAVMIHGVKTAKVLQGLQEAMVESLSIV